MKLPESFVSRMKDFFLNSSIPEEGFFESFLKEGPKGIRINSLKSLPSQYNEVASKVSPFASKVSWCKSGYYVDIESSGKDPFYHAGVYYPQEPSAMLPGELFDAHKGEIVLDLCAAPGGKSCRIGEDLQGEGLLVANEINETRAKALLRNIERMGIPNAVILNETPEKLASKLKSFFDKIIIDAPCSGEGMFRRDPNAIKSWQKYGPEACVGIQKDILNAADKMLKDGGELVYSTCTFAPSEDEEQILLFLKEHPYYEIISHKDQYEGVSVDENGFMRIWPHLASGDGHFAVHLRKLSSQGEEFNLSKLPKHKRRRDDNYGFNKSREVMYNFLSDVLVDSSLDRFKALSDGNIIYRNNQIHILPVDERVFDGLKVIKMGFFPGEIKNTTTERLFVPSNSLALTFVDNDIRVDSLLKLERDDERLLRYLKGETIMITEEEDYLKKEGVIIIAVEKYPLSFAKVSGGVIKNMYPKAWRMMN